MKKLTHEEAKLVCFAINNFGSGAHAVACNETLSFFKQDYVFQCLLRMADSDRVADAAREDAKDLAKQYRSKDEEVC